MSRLLNNWKVVVLSLIGATTFWFFNALNKSYDARISYPIEFIFDRDSVVVMKPLASTLSIDVTSGGWNLMRKTFWFNVTPIKVSLDNPTEIGYYTRSSLLPLVSDQLDELKINYLVTDTVFIDIEQKMSKKVRLRIDSLALNLADNYRMTSPIKIEPDSVMLVGPKSFVDTLSNIYQLELPIREISGNYDRDIDVSLPNQELIKSIPEEVTVTFSVDKFERKSMDVSVESINFPEDSSVYLSERQVKVFYTIAQSRDQEFGESDFAISADLSMLDKSDSTVIAILVYHPEEALDVEVIPEYIKVSYDEE